MGKVLLGILNSTRDKYMIGVMVSIEVLGVYGRAYLIAFVVFGLMTSVHNSYLPKWNKLLFGLEGSGPGLEPLFTDFVCILNLIPHR